MSCTIVNPKIEPPPKWIEVNYLQGFTSKDMGSILREHQMEWKAISVRPITTLTTMKVKNKMIPGIIE